MATIAAACVMATSFLFAPWLRANLVAAVLGLNLVVGGVSMTPIAYLAWAGEARYEAAARMTAAAATIGLSLA